MNTYGVEIIMKEQWVLMNKQADFAGLSARLGVPPLLIKLMINRGVAEEEMYDYLHGGMELIHDPFLMKDMDKAIDILETIAAKSEQIAIVSDYDCDGIFSGMILYTGLTRIGARPKLYTPERIAEGYGINRRIIDEAYNSGINYIITCDNGIAAVDEIKYAKELGLTVIITDHHEIPFELTEEGKRYIVPEADAICNPKQHDCTYPFKGLCGAGVAYKLICAIYAKNGIANRAESRLLLEYVAIATIADLMELQGENRILVKEGLKYLSETENYGLKAIKEVNELLDKKITTYHVGFVIGPCFNAAGRLETAAVAYELLQASDYTEAMELAKRLKDINDERKMLTEEGSRRGIEIAGNDEYTESKILIILLEGCHESLAGIIAGRIKEAFYKPVIVFTEGENGVYKGSGRSVPSFDMFEELMKYKDLFVRLGGHAMAAGMTIEKDNFYIFKEKLNAELIARGKDYVPVIQIDAEVLFRHMTEDIIRSMYMLEPFGTGNKKPLFAGRHFGVKLAQVVGKNRNVLKLILVDGEGSTISAVCFNNIEGFIQMVEDEYGKEQTDRMLRGASNDVDVALTFYPEINEYNGLRSVQLVVQNYCIVKRG